MKKSTKIILIVLAIILPIILLIGIVVLSLLVVIGGGMAEAFNEGLQQGLSGTEEGIVSGYHTEKDLVGTWYDSSKNLNITIGGDNTIEFCTDDKTTVYMKGTYTIKQDLDNEKGDEYIITIDANDRIANGQKYTDKYSRQFSIVTEDYKSAVMMNVSSYNLYFLTKTSDTPKFSNVSINSLNNVSTYSKSDVEKDLRNYITSKYGIELNDKCEVSKTTKGEDYGYFTPKNDPSYLIQITKSGSTYNCSYNPDHIKVRKELMDEISKYKGKNTVNSFLSFYHNGEEDGPVTKNQSANQFLEYVVYYDSSLNMDEQIKQDYKIVKKANELLNKYSNKNLDKVMIHYIDDAKVLNKNWVTDTNASFTSLSLAPNYLTGSYVESKKVSKYYYSVGLNRDYKTELKDMTESQFLEYAKKEINK